jgi:predicted HD superfamily hydrolase involved in NAD metabolism
MTVLEKHLTPKRLDQIVASLRSELSPSRMTHVLGTAHLALLLAERHNVDKEAALLAALLHDVAKYETKSEQKTLIEQHEGALESDMEDYPNLWHAVAGSILAREEYGIPSPEVSRAIRIHPTGDVDMNALEKVIFLSDYTEPKRDWEGVDKLRQMALEDLDLATDVAIVLKTKHVLSKGKGLQARACRALEAVRKKRGEHWKPREEYGF